MAAVWLCAGLIQNNLIALNSADVDGGGLAECLGLIRNNLISANGAGIQGAGHGGGLYDCGHTIENNTIIGNAAGIDGGGGILLLGDTRNCIIWGNQNREVVLFSGPPTYSCIQDWTGGGEGNISDDPQLPDPDGPDDDPLTFEDIDYHLELNSPCIDAGINQDWMRGSAVDLDGDVRIVLGTHGTRVDMGAYEHGFFRFTIVSDVRTPSNLLKLTWTSRAGDTYVLTSSAILNRPTWFQEGTIPSQGASTSFSVNIGTGSKNFYRIEMAH